MSFPYLSFSCSRTPAIKVFREVCVWWEPGVCVPVEHKKNNLEKTLTNPRVSCEIPAEPITYWGKGKSDGISGAAIIFVTSSG